MSGPQTTTEAPTEEPAPTEGQRVRCPNCGNTDIEQFYVDTLDREWNRYSVAVDTDGVLDVDEHLKSLEVVGEESRVFGCGACSTEFDDESVLRQTGSAGEDGVEALDGARVVAELRPGTDRFTVRQTGALLPVETVRSSRERIHAGIVNSGFDYPLVGMEVRIEGGEGRRGQIGVYDVAAAVAILLASGQVKAERVSGPMHGALKLDGTIANGSLTGLGELAKKR